MDDNETPAGTIALFLMGIVSLAIGLYFLFHQGDVPDPAFGADLPRVVNLQRLGIGATLCIMGSVFLTGALRPHAGAGTPRAPRTPRREYTPEPGPGAPR